MDAQEKNNKEKYLKAPEWAEIEKFLKSIKVKPMQFERFFNITKATFAKVKRGERELPAKYWHIIYEKRIPTYGFDYRKQKLASKLAESTPEVPIKPKKQPKEKNVGSGKLNNQISKLKK